mgnify:CR=1 FL=1
MRLSAKKGLLAKQTGEKAFDFCQKSTPKTRLLTLPKRIKHKRIQVVFLLRGKIFHHLNLLSQS